MAAPRGIIAIMGSGETADSMVRIHRLLLKKITPPVKAVFIDTPAGFQMNADELFERAREYFAKHLDQAIEKVSFKSAREISSFAAEKAFQTLRQADYIFVGPGSPTYALKNWINTPIPQIIWERVQNGACFIAASAAALTLGRFTLPVYEIYKVGEELHWIEGMDLLGKFGLNLVVIPHWNNAEGGTHDTRFCYLGEPRLKRLEAMLSPPIPILGVDEHTAFLIDFKEEMIHIQGRGEVTLCFPHGQKIWQSGQALPWGEFKKITLPEGQAGPYHPSPITSPKLPPEPFLDQMRSLKESFAAHLKDHRGEAMAEILLSLEKMLWESEKRLIGQQQITQARETFRGMILQIGLSLDACPKDIPAIISPLMAVLLEIREKLRAGKEWKLADFLREKIYQAGIIIEDTPKGPQWHIKKQVMGNR